MNSLKQLIALVLAVALVAGGANAALYQWSKTAATNASVDATINWAEGMSPSGVNDSARAMMARIAEWRDDTSGVLVTGGTGTAYTVTTNQGLASPPLNGQLISITPHAISGASPTLAADGGTAYPIHVLPGAFVQTNSLLPGTPYDLKFNTSVNAWILKGFYSHPAVVPIGAILDYSGTTLPNTYFALANGQCISRTTYSVYFSLVGTTFGACDGSTTFAVPDLSNRVVAGTQMGGTARITVAGGNFDGNTLGASGGAQNHTMTASELVAHSHTGTTNASTVSGTTGAGGSHNHTGPTDAETQTFTHQYQTAATKSAQATGFATIGGSLWAGADTAATTSTQSVNHTHPFTTSTAANHTHGFTSDLFTQTFTTSTAGSTSAFSIMPPAIALTKIVRIL